MGGAEGGEGTHRRRTGALLRVGTGIWGQEVHSWIGGRVQAERAQEAHRWADVCGCGGKWSAGDAGTGGAQVH